MVPIPSWMHSTFKYLSNEYSHAQIRVKMKELWPRQVGEKKHAAVRKVCRDQGKYVATGSMSRPSSMSRPVSRQAVCRDQCRDKQYVATSVATRKLCRDQKRCRNLKKSKFDIFDQISSPFHPRTIYILVF